MNAPHTSPATSALCRHGSRHIAIWQEHGARVADGVDHVGVPAGADLHQDVYPGNLHFRVHAGLTQILTAVADPLTGGPATTAPAEVDESRQPHAAFAAVRSSFRRYAPR